VKIRTIFIPIVGGPPSGFTKLMSEAFRVQCTLGVMHLMFTCQGFRCCVSYKQIFHALRESSSAWSCC